jgi:hypothetical protein
MTFEFQEKLGGGSFDRHQKLLRKMVESQARKNHIHYGPGPGGRSSARYSMYRKLESGAVLFAGKSDSQRNG